jgi:hypothetical protein
LRVISVGVVVVNLNNVVCLRHTRKALDRFSLAPSYRVVMHD